MNARADHRSRGRAWLMAVAIGAALAGCTPGPIDPIGVDPRSLTDDLIAYWSFDNVTGSVLVDDSRNHHDGVITGGTPVPGQFGGALRFTGGQVTVDNFPQPNDNGNPDWTVSAWVNISSAQPAATFNTIVGNELFRQGGWEMNSKYDPSMVYQFGYFVGPLESDYLFWNCSCAVADTWTHVAAVFDHTAHWLYFYRNGKFDGQREALDGILPGTSTLYMARWPPVSSDLAQSLGLEPETRELNGAIDEVAIYGRALGPGEIAALTQAPVPISP
jgi:hypothetical protein